MSFISSLNSMVVYVSRALGDSYKGHNRDMSNVTYAMRYNLSVN